MKDAETPYDGLKNAPGEFFRTVALLEAYWHELENVEAIGDASAVAVERVRLRQTPSSGFQGHDVDYVKLLEDRHEVGTFFFGLWGAQGAMPMHLTEAAIAERRERISPLADFVDIFHHRYLSQFYRAWARGLPVREAHLKRETALDHLGCWTGYGDPASRILDGQSHTRFSLASFYAYGTRCAEGLRRLIQRYLGESAQVHEFTGEWLPIDQEDQCRLSSLKVNSQLGNGATLGARSYQSQFNVTIEVGPLSGCSLSSFVRDDPEKKEGVFYQLGRQIRGYLGEDLSWTLLLACHGQDIEPASLSGSHRLGWNGWLGQPKGKVLDCRVSKERIFRKTWS